MAATDNKIINAWMLKNELDKAAIDPHKNNKESPGKNGIITNPVSQKIIKNNTTYIIQFP
ncbi:hypothetical protein IV36_GL000822 [Liquorilactobacillus mali]|jgi:hypothetical protein|uniref:Uncharacterized protein n=3 Tax=Liquorilactobacillus TaxID=2767888 RepID=A0A0R2DYY4_9LACO|nr:hypothetical protein FD50_GL000230 [Liquorilactobacillus satsumensis DSM 16230 = JCM 12392]KRN09089.1 hypothetical protein FD00_GL001403 [Liquorilactobacillus mali KCTC 3596 = DSM 20444]KRN33089.1 hypothetical protein IV36_GL000822 [Liquorilactobacillus mali]